MTDVRTVLVIDPTPGHRDALARSLRDRGLDVWIACDLASAAEVIRTKLPDLVVSELRLADGDWRDAHTELSRSAVPLKRLVILTSAGAIATAVAAIRRGALNFLLKPVSADQLLLAAQGVEPSRTDMERDSLSLDRAIWEIIVQAIELHGSIAAAARTLKVDRRSLRRMLQKVPPAS